MNIISVILCIFLVIKQALSLTCEQVLQVSEHSSRCTYRNVECLDQRFFNNKECQFEGHDDESLYCSYICCEIFQTIGPSEQRICQQLQKVTKSTPTSNNTLIGDLKSSTNQKYQTEQTKQTKQKKQTIIIYSLFGSCFVIPFLGVFVYKIIVCCQQLIKKIRNNSQPVDSQTGWIKNESTIIYGGPEDNCVICLSNKVDFVTKCGHTFHLNCLQSWIRRNKSCPLCKCSGELIFPGQLYCTKCLKQYITLNLINEDQLNKFSKRNCPNCIE